MFHVKHCDEENWPPDGAFLLTTLKGYHFIVEVCKSRSRSSRDGPCVHPVPYHSDCGPDGRKAHPY